MWRTSVSIFTLNTLLIEWNCDKTAEAETAALRLITCIYTITDGQANDATSAGVMQLLFTLIKLKLNDK